MELTDQQADDIEGILSEYIDNEPDTIRHAFNFGLSAAEVRMRCERWNRVIQIGDWNRMQHSYTEDDIVELIANLD